MAPKVTEQSRTCAVEPNAANKMKVLSWNVNGLRASIKNAGSDLKGLLNGLEADIICFQETKVTSEFTVRPNAPLASVCYRNMNQLATIIVYYVISLYHAGDQLDVRSYSADGYSGYFSFCRTRGGYSGMVHTLNYDSTFKEVVLCFLQAQGW